MLFGSKTYGYNILSLLIPFTQTVARRDDDPLDGRYRPRGIVSKATEFVHITRALCSWLTARSEARKYIPLMLMLACGTLSKRKHFPVSNNDSPTLHAARNRIEH